MNMRLTRSIIGINYLKTIPSDTGSTQRTFICFNTSTIPHIGNVDFTFIIFYYRKDSIMCTR